MNTPIFKTSVNGRYTSNSRASGIAGDYAAVGIPGINDVDNFVNVGYLGHGTVFVFVCAVLIVAVRAL
jgi:hypothetical protein